MIDNSAQTSSHRLMVVGAHAADFVWRSAGAIALAIRDGAQVSVVALTYGERGESAELWAREGQTIEAVKEARSLEATRAAEVLGANFTCLDLGDYPLEVPPAALARLADLMRDYRPDLIITHTAIDPFNPDHGFAHSTAVRAMQLATGAGRAAAFETINQPQVLLFEPHYPEPSQFMPDVYVDITSVAELKTSAMAAFASQRYMPEYQSLRSHQRAWQARRFASRADITEVEVFQRFTPEVVTSLWRD